MGGADQINLIVCVRACVCLCVPRVWLRRSMV